MYIFTIYQLKEKQLVKLYDIPYLKEPTNEYYSDLNKIQRDLVQVDESRIAYLSFGDLAFWNIESY